MYNPTELNLGDEGYDPNEDEGAFIIQTRVNARGVGAKKKMVIFYKILYLLHLVMFLM